MPAIRIVDRIRDQGDFNATLIDGGVVQYEESSDKFVLIPASYTHTQLSPLATWTIHHNLNRFPAVSVVDSSGNDVIGEVHYTDSNTIVITFSSAFGGTAYLS